MFRVNSVTTALLSAGILVAAVPARADQIGDLEAALHKLQAQIEELRAQQAATVQKLAAQPAAAAAVTINPAPVIPAATDIGTASQLVPIPHLLQVQTAGGNFMLYGDADEYLNSMHSSSGAKVTALQDGAILRSRIGLSGSKALSPGYTASFALETGINATNGTQADQANANSTGLTTSGRLFDRQAWAGVATPYGEFRFGRQNTEIFYAGNYIDYTERTLGSVASSFGAPSRYDADITYIAPRFNGVQVAAHYALGGGGQQTTAATNQGVFQYHVNYVNGPIRVGYVGLQAKPSQTGIYTKDVYYRNLYANYDYGQGTIYAVYIHSNNGGGALNNTGGNEVGNIPTVLAGTSASVLTPYDVYQLSADYRVTSTLRVGGLYGMIRDSVNAAGDASGWSLGAYWQAFSNVMFYGLADSIANRSSAAFGLAGSAGLTKAFSGNNLTGQRITGAQVGGLFRF